MYFASLAKITRDLFLYYTILGILKALVDGGVTASKMRRDYLSREKEISYCLKLKKGKLKTKKFVKLLGILDEQEPSVKQAE